MTRRAKPPRAKPGRDPWNLTARGIAATDLDDLADRTGLTVFERAMASEALDAASARAAWGPRPASPSTPTGKPVAGPSTPTGRPGSDTRRETPREAQPIARNTPPATVWEALRRLLGCNRQELAARLGVSRHTLQRWERGEPTQAGADRVAALMQETLAAARAGWTVTPLFSPRTLERGQRAAKTPG